VPGRPQALKPRQATGHAIGHVIGLPRTCQQHATICLHVRTIRRPVEIATPAASA